MPTKATQIKATEKTDGKPLFSVRAGIVTTSTRAARRCTSKIKAYAKIKSSLK
jgi:hypothetical protein